MNGMMGIYGDLFGEINRMQKNLDQLLTPMGTVGIRAMPRRTFPVINVGSTPEAIEVLALAPGIYPNALQITVDKGVLVIAGERKTALPEDTDNTSLYAQERFDGSFRRVVSLPDDVDASKVEANYRDGMLRVRLGRLEASKPRRIEVK
ncbi:MAG: Hsp20/alpha crystallin family protein [Polaromonas sp.]|nr:Hsp20/alpha crystallin family protein [Polaromonas sp.]